jgi:hypothetical protein
MVNVVIFWDTGPRGQYVNRRFGGTCHLSLQGRKISRARNQRVGNKPASQPGYQLYWVWRVSEKEHRANDSRRNPFPLTQQILHNWHPGWLSSHLLQAGFFIGRFSTLKMEVTSSSSPFIIHPINRQ